MWLHYGFKGRLTQGWAQAQEKQLGWTQDHPSTPTPEQLCWRWVDLQRAPPGARGAPGGFPPAGAWWVQVWVPCWNHRKALPPWRWQSGGVKSSRHVLMRETPVTFEKMQLIKARAKTLTRGHILRHSCLEKHYESAEGQYAFCSLSTHIHNLSFKTI